MFPETRRKKKKCCKRLFRRDYAPIHPSERENNSEQVNGRPGQRSQKERVNLIVLKILKEFRRQKMQAM